MRTAWTRSGLRASMIDGCGSTSMSEEVSSTLSVSSSLSPCFSTVSRSRVISSAVAKIFGAGGVFEIVLLLDPVEQTAAV